MGQHGRECVVLEVRYEKKRNKTKYKQKRKKNAHFNEKVFF